MGVLRSLDLKLSAGVGYSSMSMLTSPAEVVGRGAAGRAWVRGAEVVGVPEMESVFFRAGTPRDGLPQVVGLNRGVSTLRGHVGAGTAEAGTSEDHPGGAWLPPR